MGRTQEILALLAILMREGHLKPQPVTSAAWAAFFTEITTWNRTAPIASTQLQLHDALNLTVLDQGQVEKMKLTGGRLFSSPRA